MDQKILPSLFMQSMLLRSGVPSVPSLVMQSMLLRSVDPSVPSLVMQSMLLRSGVPSVPSLVMQSMLLRSVEPSLPSLVMQSMLLRSGELSCCYCCNQNAGVEACCSAGVASKALAAPPVFLPKQPALLPKLIPDADL